MFNTIKKGVNLLIESLIPSLYLCTVLLPIIRLYNWCFDIIDPLVLLLILFLVCFIFSILTKCVHMLLIYFVAFRFYNSNEFF